MQNDPTVANKPAVVKAQLFNVFKTNVNVEEVKEAIKEIEDLNQEIQASELQEVQVYPEQYYEGV